MSELSSSSINNHVDHLALGRIVIEPPEQESPIISEVPTIPTAPKETVVISSDETVNSAPNSSPLKPSIDCMQDLSWWTGAGLLRHRMQAEVYWFNQTQRQNKT